VTAQVVVGWVAFVTALALIRFLWRSLGEAIEKYTDLRDDQ